jgi:cell division protein ZapE
MSEARDVFAVYREALARRGFVADRAQERAVARLQQLYEEWSAYKARRSNALKRLLVRPPLPRGVYLWGPVGRGKSFLMDAFYLCVPLVRKHRVHFHAFMRDVHRQLDALKGTEDPIGALAERTARRWRLVCFDEFQVTDIADAMILGRFLARVMDRGVAFVMTSNYHPDELYAGGLQRERFAPAIGLLKARLDVLEVDGGTDYRRLKMGRVRTWHTGAGAETELARIFDELRDVEQEREPLEVEGRRLPYRRRAGGVVWFDFAALCESPRSYADYVELARRFHTVLVSGVPRLGARDADAARRLTWLVDVFYDERVKLVVGAEVPPEEVFAGAVRTAAECERTVSRLLEMRSADYLGAERRRAGVSRVE